MELLLFLLALILLDILALRYGVGSRLDERRFLSKEQELASYGVSWNHPARQPPR